MTMADAPSRTKRPREQATQPAMTFPYDLDPFQKSSIEVLENGDSVLVSAHTSAGKTTVALYAIAKSLREHKRVIYTSPIKALSNQKFREFSAKFDSVGLMTGDTTIKSDADCLVMTTEILRSMLYRGTEMLREVGCVIFDEVHYMRDKSRGVVWEETISLLPEGCQYAFLSATIPNAREFADWVESIHPKTRVHVIHTDYRPVPLQHYLYPAGADGIFLIVDEKGKFRDDNFTKAMMSMGDESSSTAATAAANSSSSNNNNSGGGGGAAARGGGGARGGARGTQRAGVQSIMEIIKLVMDRNMYPVIVFSFAKAECERNALALSRLNFNDTDEDALVTEVYHNAMESLSEDDRKLPAIEHLLPLLKRGIGIHHSGLLPILKEVVEVLFQAGLVKVLFSTETFSMGLNMPARTVVFTSVKKFDGERNRYLTGGEYIQMSGRAGRRGLDRVGVVIAMVDEAVEPDTLRQLTGGGADVLLSSFHLTYNMVLNLLRVEDVDPEFMMRRSFAQFQRLRHRPALEATQASLRVAIADMHLAHEEDFRQYALCQRLLERKMDEVRAVLRQPRYVKNWAQPGRFVRIVRASDKADFGWGICRGWTRRATSAPLPPSPSSSTSTTTEATTTTSTTTITTGNTRDNSSTSSKSHRSHSGDDDASAFAVTVSVICHKLDPTTATATTPSAVLTACHVTEYTSATAELYMVTFDFADIAVLSTLKCNLPAQPDSETGRAQMVQTLSRLHREFGDDKVPALTPAQMGVDDDAHVAKLQAQIVNLQAQVAASPLQTSATPELLAEYDTYKRKSALEEQLARVTDELASMHKAVFSDELRQMMRVLRRLDYIDKDNIILRKARVACEITTTDENEILLTELLFRGVLNSMETEMIVALLSCLVNVHRTPDGFTLPHEFEHPLRELNDVVTRIAAVSAESGLTAQEGGGGSSSSVEKVMPSLMEVTYLWAKGAKFVDLVSKTTAYEGDIVRMMRRLEEMLRQLAAAARSPAIGSVELHEKFLRGIQLIKRDIVFASSLYL